MKPFFLLTALLTLCAPCLRAADNKLPTPPGEEGFLFFSADNGSVEPNTKKINLQGNVTIVQQLPDGRTRTVQGQDVTLDQLNTQITSLGLLTMKSDAGQFQGTDMRLNYVTKDFAAKDITTEYPPLRVLGAKEISSVNGKDTLRDVTLTCCDAADPHYTLTVGKLTVSPEKRVFGTNAVFRLDGFPVFYLPVFWRSLESKKPFTTHVDFTQSGKVGFGVLTSTVFEPMFGFRPTLNLDFYTKSGVGVGGAMTAITSPTLRGTGEFYYINDQSDASYNVDNGLEEKRLDLKSRNRWGFRGGYWWEIADTSDAFTKETGALYQFQTQFRMVSDPYFNDSFFRGNPYIFMPDQQTNFSLSRQSRVSSLRVTYEQQDIFDWDQGKFIAQQRDLPSVQFLLMPFADPLLGLSHRMEVNFNNTSLMEEAYQRSGNARWTTEKSIRLGRNLTFLPSVFYDQQVTLQDNNYDDKDAWVGRIGTDLNLQTDTLLGTVDFGYQYTQRLSTDTIKRDNLSPDRGQERNRLYLQDYFRPSFNTYVRLAAGFDLNSYASWDHPKSRVEPILVEAGYNSPDGTVNLFAQNLYDLEDKNQAFIAQSYFTVKNQLLGFGLTNYTTQLDPTSLYQTYSDRYTFTTSLGIRPASNTWQMDLGFDFQLQDRSFSAFNKMVRVMKVFHDASLEMTLRDRNDNLSFSFRVNILCGGNEREKMRLPEDNYYYPWRNPNDLRDL